MRARSIVCAAALAVGTTACADDPAPAGTASTSTVSTSTVSTSTVSSVAVSAPSTGAVSTSVAPPASASVPVSAVVPTGYVAVRATATTADGTVCDLCLWLAESGAQRQQGLMFVTDLGDADGMAFVYPSPHTGSFWMKNTLLPLSIAFYDASGAYLDAFDMEPCTADPCPTYPTPPDFVVAVETSAGALSELGLTPGSTLALTDLPCA